MRLTAALLYFLNVFITIKTKNISLVFVGEKQSRTTESL